MKALPVLLLGTSALCVGRLLPSLTAASSAPPAALASLLRALDRGPGGVRIEPEVAPPLWARYAVRRGGAPLGELVLVRRDDALELRWTGAAAVGDLGGSEVAGAWTADLGSLRCSGERLEVLGLTFERLTGAPENAIGELGWSRDHALAAWCVLGTGPTTTTLELVAVELTPRLSRPSRQSCSEPGGSRSSPAR